MIPPLSIYCDCSCHVRADGRTNHNGCCFCAPCAFCRRSVRLIFLRQHQDLCGMYAAGELQDPIEDEDEDCRVG